MLTACDAMRGSRKGALQLAAGSFQARESGCESPHGRVWGGGTLVVVARGMTSHQELCSDFAVNAVPPQAKGEGSRMVSTLERA